MVLLGAADWFNTWLTPIWLISVGMLAAFIVLLVVWGILFVISPAGARRIPTIITEGPLAPIFYTFLIFAVFGVVGAVKIPGANKARANTLIRDVGEFRESIQRFPFTGTNKKIVAVPPANEGDEDEAVVLPVKFRADELRTIEVESDQNIRIVSEVTEKGDPIFELDVEAEELKSWDRGVLKNNPFEAEGMDKLLIFNESDQAANVTFSTYTAPLHPQASSVYVTLFVVLAIFVIYFLLHWLFPKTSAIALATAKSELGSPLFVTLMLLGFFLLGLFHFLPYNTFGEDIKVLKDSGMTLIMVFAIFSAVWAGSTSVAEEIEGKTALTVLSKPIGRRQFILGKFFGIGWSTAVLIIVLGAWLLIVVAYKPIYDARETANTAPNWQACHMELVSTVPGLFLAYLEVLVFTALSVAISTRLPMLANVMICFAIYAFGHLTPLLVQGAEGKFENVAFVARFIATVLPVLDHFNIQAAISSGARVSYGYLGMATVYCALYCTIAVLLALVLFEDRDLA